MQKFITLLFFSIFSMSVSYGQQTKLSISPFNSYALRIIVDNQTYSLDKSRGDADLVITDLAGGNHRIQIYRLPVRPRRGGFGNNAIQAIYDANIYLRAQYFTDLMINRFGRVFKDEMLIDQYTENPNPQHPQSPNPHINAQMSPENFEALKTTLRNEGFDNSRLNIAKQAAAANFFSAAQVKELMQLFSYDESRLDIAKTFYPRTIDKGNYFMVSDAFSFSSSKDALMEFIRNNP